MAHRSSDLDPVIQMLLLQTVKPSFENITHDDLKLTYIKKEMQKEWKHKKDVILKEALFYNGINPGVGKWVHEKINSDKIEQKHEQHPCAIKKACVEQHKLK